jgi:hypothetical protein
MLKKILNKATTKVNVAILSGLAFSGVASADTDNSGTTLTIPTFITGDQTTGQLGWFELIGNTIAHYVNEYFLPLLAVAFGFGWLFYMIFFGNRKGKQAVSS